MLTFDTITDARKAIMDFYAAHFSEVDEKYRARFVALSASPSPVDQIVGVGEFIYGNRGGMPDSAKSLAASLIAFANINAWHGLMEDDRGNKVVANLRKEIGEITKAPAAPDPRLGTVIETPAPAPAPAPEVAE